MGQRVVQIIIGLGIVVFGGGGLRNYLQGWGQEPSRINLKLVPPERATKFQRYFLLFESCVLLIAGVLVVFVKL